MVARRSRQRWKRLANEELTPEEELTPAETAAEAKARELEGDLETVLSSPLFAGPDASIVEDVKALPDVEVDATQHLAEDMALEEQVAKIYASIVARAPEHKVQPSLDRVRDCLDMMGNPQNAYRAIHITGTNGKTSTARMIEALLRERGLRTGRFTSPHLQSVRERISIDGQAISRAGFIQAWEDVAPFVEMVDAKSEAEGGPRMSFFEVFVVMAYAAFADAPIDVAVVEVGMGGTWDATNVIDAEVAVLMTVARDHEKWLGASLEEIATEKLGIVKEGATVITAEQQDVVEELIAKRVTEQHASLVYYGPNLHVVDREVAVGGQMMTIRTPSAVYEDVPLAMHGEYQSRNAAVALAAVEAFFGGGALPGEVVEHALMSTSSPARLEVVRSSPTVIVDAAHNPAGAAATREALEESFLGPRVAVFSAMADKDVDGILAEIEPAFEAIVVTQIEGERAMDIEDIAEIARDVFGEERVRVEPDVASAIVLGADIAETVNPDSVAPAVTVVIGSIMLAAEARRVLGAAPPDQPRKEK